VLWFRGGACSVVPAEEANDAFAALRARSRGRDASVIGEIRAEPEGVVALRNGLGRLHRETAALVGRQPAVAHG
jgi:hydrogenase maturation factor